MRIIGHRTIGAENAAVGNVHQAHAVPVGTVGIQGLQIGLRTAEKILTQMGGSFRRHEADGKFTAEAILPIVPEDADE